MRLMRLPEPESTKEKRPGFPRRRAGDAIASVAMRILVVVAGSEIKSFL